ncbi:xylanase/chitin deacetylase [Penicillium odoratum]|uniref:xylanase/chitin deacetylase n=1 Tax=Penicillium odoratum TaxID=1167516 RepID=UPI0025466AC7|nr:xylanase/chitin deacetylase [Penicillium odoratum]KAJ5769048.1 xylanase/chitin deacetylase [Penicillium odoratum]
MQNLVGKSPHGYCAPIYQLRETTLDLLEELDSTAILPHHGCQLFRAPKRPRRKPIGFSKPEATWMHPIKETYSPPDRKPLGMMPMQFVPHDEDCQGHVDVRVIEKMWRNRFQWI